jgi:DNA-binding response OmpR family regulator
LRAKIEPPKSEKYIKTRPGIGYMMRSEHEKPSEVAS